MPLVPFDSLPDDARLWVFASDAPVAPGLAPRLLAEVDAFLSRWNAHGMPLTCGRDWRDGRFLAIGVDQSTAGASGCSIDGLFRSLRALEPVLGASLLDGGLVFYRDAAGEVRSVDRAGFMELASRGDVSADTPVFDTTAATAGEWRRAFERPLRESWHAELAGA
jgi:hypothetical protein